jgi:hypothetical protein
MPLAEGVIALHSAVARIEFDTRERRKQHNIQQGNQSRQLPRNCCSCAPLLLERMLVMTVLHLLATGLQR